MKLTLPILLLMTLSFQCKTTRKGEIKDLKDLQWIEGNWKGMDGNTPFYEIYQLQNDSTLVITSYEWDGKDSSKTTVSYLRRKDDAFYLGDQYNWKVTALSENAISMEPVFQAANSILWQKKDQTTWEAILESKKGRKVYLMERVNHFPIPGN